MVRNVSRTDPRGGGGRELTSTTLNQEETPRILAFHEGHPRAKGVQCCQTVRFFGQRPILRFLSENRSEKESV